MVFASFVFVFAFLPVFLAGYFALPGLRAKNLFLTLASYVFYGWWRPDYVLLMLGSTVVDWWCARQIGRSGARSRKLWLLVSLGMNLGLLGWFKYANFFVDTWGVLVGTQPQWVAIALPIGISFYTFQSMSYTIDVWRGRIEPVRSFLDLACYVSMFPQLVAGPIVRYRDVAEQLVRRKHSLEQFGLGALLFMAGFAKKVLIADNCALIADPVFAAATPGSIESWLGLCAYALQIYFDFSGYSDMAIGLALMIGFTLPENFRSPYCADSITDFWHRWHISLSTWLRDYLYVPLGGNQHGAFHTHRNLMLTMLLGGLWHGAAWNFVLWGGYQGVMLAVERMFRRRPLYAGLPRFLRVALTFILVMIGWAMFRAVGMGGLSSIFGGLFGTHGEGSVPIVAQYSREAWAAFGLGLLLVFAAPRSRIAVERSGWLADLCWFALFLLALAQLSDRQFSPFIYFQF
jgi:alginate O-acetyltransferase complex protein AlgI